MAANATTGIDPEVDRFVYVEAFDSATFAPNNPATYRVLNYNEQWRLDGEPRVGANPRFMRFKKLPTDTAEADHRYTVTSTPEMIATDALPITDSSLPVGTYQIIQQAVKLSEADLKIQVETAFQSEVRKQFPDTENPATLLLAAKALAKKQSGAVLTTDEQATLDAITSVGDRIDQLVAAKAAFDAAIEADEDYDLSIWPTV